MRTVIRTAALAGLTAVPFMAQAAAPTLGDVLTASGITEAGYVDAGYNWNNRNFSRGAFNGGNAGSFELNQVGLALSKLPSSGFGGSVDVLAGNDAAGVPSEVGSDIIIKQAYVQYANGALTVMGGRFVTLAGMEVINSSQNSNATRSILFGYQPLVHTGVRAAYKLGDELTITGGLNNAANVGVIDDNNQDKTIELSLSSTPLKGLTASLTGYYGNESTAAGPGGSPSIVDLVVSYQLSDALSLGLNADYVDPDGTVGAPAPAATLNNVKGVALYGNFQAMSDLRLGTRVEYVDAGVGNGTGGTAGRTQKEVTLTADYAAAKNFDLLTDLRWDKDTLAGFPGAFAGAGFGGDKSSDMVSITIKGIYKF